MDKNYGVITLISKCPFLREPRLAKFSNIIKIVTMCTIKTTLTDSRKVKDIRKKNADGSTIQGVCHMIYMIFAFSLGKA